jgi:hypothetical protein
VIDSVHLSTALLGAPWQVFVVALLAVGLLAPQLLPKLGRMLGRTLRAEVFRRVGLSPSRRVAAETVASPRPIPRMPAPEAAVEILAPERPDATLRAGSKRSLEPQRTAKGAAPIWLVTFVAFAAAGAIFWLLLHTR